MGEVPIVNSREVVRAFERLGWAVARQRGSHIIMVRFGVAVTLSVPNHRPVAPGTLRSLIRSAGITVEAIIEALKG